MPGILTTTDRERLDAAIVDFSLLPIDPESLACVDGDDPFLLVELGRSASWVSTHASPEDAADYTLGQEYAEDWTPIVLIERSSGRRFAPQLTWKPVL